MNRSNILLNKHSLLLVLIASTLLFGCTPKITQVKQETSQYRLSTKESTADSLTTLVIAPYKKQLDLDLSKIIATSEQAMEKGFPEGLLGNFASDACLIRSNEILNSTRKIQADFCFLNNGGLRSALPKGPIAKSKIFELMPFENELVCLVLSGETTKQLLDFIAAKGGMPVSGLRMEIKEKQASNVKVNGIIFDDKKEYKIITSDYLASGGDDLGFLSNAKEKIILNEKVRDAIIQYLEDETKKGKTIHVAIEGRITKP